MYEYNLRLKHTEVPAIIDSNTGEVRKVNTFRNSKSDHFEYMNVNTPFNKTFSEGWSYLADVLTGNQLKIAVLMSNSVKPVTNSLVPLSDDISFRKLAEHFGVSKTTVKADLDKLFKEGVFAKFELYEDKYKHTRYWVFNPYLSYNGRGIHRKTKSLFENTRIAKLVIGSRG